MSDPIQPWMRDAARAIPGYVEDTIQVISKAYAPERARLDAALAGLAEKWRSPQGAKWEAAHELEALRRELLGGEVKR